MTAKLRAQANDADWASLLEVERALEAQIAAARRDAQWRVAQAREAAAAAMPDPQALAVLAAAQERADAQCQRGELERIAEQAHAAVLALTQAPDTLIDALAQQASDAVIADTPATERR
jgi:hypothetical protein